MTRLSDTQLVILNAAAQRDDGNALPLPGSLRGGAASKVVGALLSRSLVEERVTDSLAKADAALNTFWRNDDEGRAILLRITAEGLAAIGVEPEGSEPEAAAEAGDSAPEGAGEAPSAEAGTKGPPARKLPHPRPRGRARAPSRRSSSPCCARAPPSTRWSPPPAGSRTPCAAPWPAR